MNYLNFPRFGLNWCPMRQGPKLSLVPRQSAQEDTRGGSWITRSGNKLTGIMKQDDSKRKFPLIMIFIDACCAMAIISLDAFPSTLVYANQGRQDLNTS
jgi:hypothetical protein